MIGATVKGLAIGAAVALIPGVVPAQGNAERGESLFAQNCGTCHGPEGKGDGPAAPGLNPKPRDLTDKAYMAGLKDAYLFELIKNGGAAVGKSPLMPPFGSMLKDEDVRGVIAFVRSLAK